MVREDRIIAEKKTASTNESYLDLLYGKKEQNLTINFTEHQQKPPKDSPQKSGLTIGEEDDHPTLDYLELLYGKKLGEKTEPKEE